MKIVVSGGTGFLGSALCRALVADGHDVVILTRSAATAGSSEPSGTRIKRVAWNPNGAAGAWASELDDAGGVINLAGESIAGGRWTSARKARILDSRVMATRSLVEAIAGVNAPPRVFVSGSATGFYGFSDDQPLTEVSPPGSDFLARVCVEWEQEAQRAASPQTRLVLVRTGVVLEKDGGALPKMMLPFRLFAGGPVGSGRQYVSWIHRDDWVDLVRRALVTPAAAGPLNATAPTPVTNAELSAAIGRALNRPSWLPAPAFAMRFALGEMADILLKGQRVIPQKALDLGFQFRFPDPDEALEAIVGS